MKNTDTDSIKSKQLVKKKVKTKAAGSETKPERQDKEKTDDDEPADAFLAFRLIQLQTEEQDYLKFLHHLRENEGQSALELKATYDGYAEKQKVPL